MRIRIVTFGLNIPAEAYLAHAVHIAPEFTAWPGLLSKWWLGDTASGTFGGVYLFASTHDADRSRETDLFQGMFANPALKDVAVQDIPADQVRLGQPHAAQVCGQANPVVVHARRQGRGRRIARHPALFAAELDEVQAEAAEVLG